MKQIATVNGVAYEYSRSADGRSVTILAPFPATIDLRELPELRFSLPQTATLSERTQLTRDISQVVSAILDAGSPAKG